MMDLIKTANYVMSVAQAAMDQILITVLLVRHNQRLREFMIVKAKHAFAMWDITITYPISRQIIYV